MFALDLILFSRPEMQIRDPNGKFATWMIFILFIALWLGRKFAMEITLFVKNHKLSLRRSKNQMFEQCQSIRRPWESKHFCLSSSLQKMFRSSFSFEEVKMRLSSILSCDSSSMFDNVHRSLGLSLQKELQKVQKAYIMQMTLFLKFWVTCSL